MLKLTVGHDHASFKTVGENSSGVLEQTPPDNTAQHSSIDLEQHDSVESESPDTDGENQSDVDQPVEPAPPDDPAPRTSTDSAQEETKERELTEDAFSFLFVTEPWPWTWENGPVLVVAVGIWFLQMAIYLIVLLSSFETQGSNKLDFPPNVDIPTRIAEVIAIIITSFTQDDLRTLILFMGDRHFIDKKDARYSIED